MCTYCLAKQSIIDLFTLIEKFKSNDYNIKCNSKNEFTTTYFVDTKNIQRYLFGQNGITAVRGATQPLSSWRLYAIMTRGGSHHTYIYSDRN